MLPVPEVVEEYWEATTEYVSTISVPSLARAKEIGEKWFSDLTRFGPSPGVSIPGLGAFEVPAPPPAPVIPPAIPWYKENSTLIIAGAAGVGTIGVGLMLKYTLTNKKKKRKESPDLFKIRREIVGESVKLWQIKEATNHLYNSCFRCRYNVWTSTCTFLGKEGLRGDCQCVYHRSC